MRQKSVLSHTFMICVALLLLPSDALANCIKHAKSATSYQIIDSHTILFTGGTNGEFLVKTLPFDAYPPPSVGITKDTLCTGDSILINLNFMPVLDVSPVK